MYNWDVFDCIEEEVVGGEREIDPFHSSLTFSKRQSSHLCRHPFDGGSFFLSIFFLSSWV